MKLNLDQIRISSGGVSCYECRHFIRIKTQCKLGNIVNPSRITERELINDTCRKWEVLQVGVKKL